MDLHPDKAGKTKASGFKCDDDQSEEHGEWDLGDFCSAAEMDVLEGRTAEKQRIEKNRPEDDLQKEFIDDGSEDQMRSLLARVPDIAATLGDRLCNFTHRAIGDPSRALPCLSLVSNKSRLEWLAELEKEGYSGLLYVDMRSMKDQAGYKLSWWFENRKSVKRRLVKTPLEEKAEARIFTAKQVLPVGSLINAVMCTVSELVGSDKPEKYVASTPQLFLPSTGGFSQDFRHEDTAWAIDSKIIRCFWLFGPGEEVEEKGEATPPERQFVFVGSAGNNTKIFGDWRVVTLAGYFGEADRKFRLHPGDILVMKGCYPFAIDLPVAGSAEGTRLLSWIVMPEKDMVSGDFPVVMPRSELMMSIDDLAPTNSDASQHRAGEFDEFEIAPGPPGDPEGHMQRLRVTPKKYDIWDIIEEVENNASIVYINTSYFKDN